MPQLRRSYGKVSTNATGLLYLLCFRERLGTDKHSIKHYLGFTWDLDARLEKHRAGQGARITEVLKERGIHFDVAAVWPGNRGVENQLKLHSATRICPRCTPGAQPPQLVQAVIKAEAQRRAQEARKAAPQIRETQRSRPPSPSARPCPRTSRALTWPSSGYASRPRRDGPLSRSGPQTPIPPARYVTALAPTRRRKRPPAAVGGRPRRGHDLA